MSLPSCSAIDATPPLKVVGAVWLAGLATVTDRPLRCGMCD